MMLSQRTVGNFFGRPMFDQLNFPHTGGRPEVIHDRISFIKSLGGEDVLIGDAFVLIGRRRAVAMKPDMMLLRNLTELLIVRHGESPPLQISSSFLLALEGFEKRFEISFTEALGSLALNDFEKEGRPVFDWFGENLEQVAFVVAINQNA